MEPLRIAVVSSPRSGNSWVRAVIARALTLDEIAVHNYLDVPTELPTRCCLQLHWYREPNFQAFLRSHNFRVVVLSRHPLDVLVSVLHFIKYEPMTSEWLKGNAQIPFDLAGKPAASDDFLGYATSWGAENLLSITYQWANDQSAVVTRYEDLVQSPQETFAALATQLDLPADTFTGASAEVGFKFFKELPNRHGWHGTPGLWRQLVRPHDDRVIYRRHQRIFDYLGYSVPFSFLRRSTALKNWNNLRR